MVDERDALVQLLEELKIHIGDDQDRIKRFVQTMQGHLQQLQLQLAQVQSTQEKQEILSRTYQLEYSLQQANQLQNTVNQYVWTLTSFYNWALEYEKRQVRDEELEEELEEQLEQELANDEKLRNRQRQEQENQNQYRNWALDALKKRMYLYPP